MFAFFLAVGAGFLAMFARSLTRPLTQLARAVEDIQRGGANVHVPVRSLDEVGALAEGVNALADTLREREHILRTFGRVVDPAVRDRLLSGTASPQGERREVAVLFADVRAFTRFAEGRSPEDVVATLNALFAVMTATVRAAGGSVDKFLGDGMLAVFGLFDDDADRAADAAVRGALELRREVAAFAARRSDAGEEGLRVAVAVHAGPVVAATLGAEERFDYTIVGDAVNVTSRLLDVARERDRDLVVSAEALRRAHRAGNRQSADWTGEVELRGRAATVEVCTLAGA
jgi:adenylate cyclase